MQPNYSHLKILKLKIYSSSLFLVVFCAHITWWKDFATLNICVFSLPSFLDTKCPIIASSFFEKCPELIKDSKGPLLQNNKIVKQENFLTGRKIFTQNNLIISIVLIW